MLLVPFLEKRCYHDRRCWYQRQLCDDNGNRLPCAKALEMCKEFPNETYLIYYILLSKLYAYFAVCTFSWTEWYFQHLSWLLLMTMIAMSSWINYVIRLLIIDLMSQSGEWWRPGDPSFCRHALTDSLACCSVPLVTWWCVVLCVDDVAALRTCIRCSI